MRHMLFRVLGLAALLAVSATTAAAHTLNVTISADCSCKYSVTVSGNTDAFAVVGVDYSFNVTENGNTIPVTGHIDTTADQNGNFSATQSNLSLPTSCTASVSFSGGSATLTFNGNVESGFGVTLPSTLSCGTPPTGKSLEIGPSSMEGHLQIRPGDWISGGYSFKFVNGGHGDETVTVSSTLTIPFKCPQGGGSGGSFVINLGTHTYFVPANNTDWQPTGDANNVLSWAGSGQAPDGCSGNIMDNSKGAIFDTNISQSPDNGQLLNWRFKYRHPNAKGKGNDNCLDTSDPRRAKADVCGASWSETVRDP